MWRCYYCGQYNREYDLEQVECRGCNAPRTEWIMPKWSERIHEVRDAGPYFAKGVVKSNHGTYYAPIGETTHWDSPFRR